MAGMGKLKFLYRFIFGIVISCFIYNISFDTEKPKEASTSTSLKYTSSTGKLDTSEHAESTGTRDTNEHAESTGTRDTNKHVGSTGTRDTSEHAESTGTRDTNEHAESAGTRDTSEHAESTGTRDPNKHAESSGTRDTSEHAESTGTRDTSEHAESTGTRDTNEHAESTGTRDTSEHAESTGTRDTSEHAESTGTRDTSERAERKPTSKSTRNNSEDVAAEYVFREYNDSKGVYTIRDLCIERSSRQHKNVLVVYNSDHTSKHQELLKDHHTPISGYPGWPVFHRKGPIPVQHVIMDHPAYFMVTVCEGNLHHYIEESLLGLQGLLEATGRLGERNQVFTKTCKSVPEDIHMCHSFNRYLDLALNLNVIPETYGCFEEFPTTNVCYKHAGFGYKAMDKKEFCRYQLSQFGLSSSSCAGPGILLVDRTYRKILNVQQLEEATKALKLPNTHVETVDFEGLSLKEQAAKVYCKHIMVGVQGAGLEWINFLPDHSAILEIGWKKWESKYVHRGSLVGVKGKFLDKKDNVSVNWEVYHEHNKKVKLTEKKKKELLADDILDGIPNPYKYADVRIDVNVYMKNLLELIIELQKDGVKF